MKLNPYLNFDGTTEEAFRFYAAAFGAELTPIVRFGDMPMEGVDISAADKNKVMHVGLPLGDGQMLMGTDILGSQGQKLTVGNNTYISVHPDTKEEADRLFAALSQGGEIEMPMSDQSWGDYWGAFADRFGIQWMINYRPQKA